ncbi:MAG: UPF0182 family protein [Chloroflexi bacterium]|nr:UPF0182 family protein [Chloroflexota bacterium]
MNLLDNFERRGQVRRSSVLRWAIPLGILALLWVGGSIGTGIYTDWLWFDHLGYLSVYTKILSTRVLLFTLGSLVFLGFFALNVVFAVRFSPRGISPQAALNIPLEALNWARRLVNVGIILGALLLAIVFGAAASGSWELTLRSVNAVPFNQTDPLYQKEISFYLFNLPFYRFVQGWLLGTTVVAGLVALGIYAINFALGGFQFTVTPSLRAHLSALGALLFLLLAAGYWLSLQELVFSTRGAAYGAGYADVLVRLRATQLLIALSMGVALLLAINVYLRGATLPVIGIGVWLAVLVVGTALLPAAIERFQVNPNQFALEQPYIRNTIQMTREGFALNRIQEKDYQVQGEINADSVAGNRLTIDNIRLWDHRPLRDVYNNIQFVQLQYSFPDIDVDRYTVDGRYRQVMVGTRELTQIPGGAQTWVNRKLQFTHGYGVAMSPVTEFTSDGLPIFFVKDMPPVSQQGGPPVERPQVYYGEATNDWVIVQTNTPEYDYETATGPTFTKYAGNGIPLGGFLRRLILAWRFGDVNILITNEVQPNSQILYFRQVQDRVHHLAPFLRLDKDPYIVAADGKLYWVQDAYTVSNRFPYSEPTQEGFNYIRNSVKAVVDAYEGTVDLYIADPHDAIINTYAQVFPGLFKPLDQMPASLRAHLRYPEDFFLVQARKYLKFHMTDPQEFYSQSKLWSMPNEVFFEKTQPMEPYYLIMRLPEESKEEFVLILPFTRADKPNLASWLAARSDGPQYGSLIAYSFPIDRQIDGPEQVEAAIATNPLISQQFTLWSQAGSRVLRGNLIVIPVANNILYAEPIYLQPENFKYPKLTRVILVAQGKEPVMLPSLEESLAAFLGKQTVVQRPGGAAPSGPASVAERVRQELERVQSTLADLQKQLGDLSKTLQDVLTGPGTPPAPTPTPAR